jgi:ankyrin repeat protein
MLAPASCNHQLGNMNARSLQIGPFLTLLIIVFFIGCSDPDRALRSAVEKGNVTDAQAALQSGANVNARGSGDIYTPLMEASVRGDVEMVRLLIDSGANVNQWSKSVPGPLMLACASGEYEVAQILLSAGADVNVVVNQTTPLIRAIGSENRELVELLIASKADLEPEELAARR